MTQTCPRQRHCLKVVFIRNKRRRRLLRLFVFCCLLTLVWPYWMASRPHDLGISLQPLPFPFLFFPLFVFAGLCLCSALLCSFFLVLLELRHLLGRPWLARLGLSEAKVMRGTGDSSQ
ncbi:hypothetical protein F4780DRAFT_723206 [Xylariomycetidae sp. FL0641]|nr:hypothetical protein F4780DRAFT_723206 [Xylariomycetidae sp. FL0641]